MTTFLTEHWIMAIVVFGGILLAAIGVVVGIVAGRSRRDRGLMRAAEGKALHWDRSNYPIPVWYASDLDPEWIVAWAHAASVINKAVDKPVFMDPLEAPVSLDVGRHVSGAVLLRDDDGVDPGHGVTDLRYDQRTGQILSAEVTLPEARSHERVTYPVVLHEAGHVLGLAHDESKQSIMYPTLTDRPPRLTGSDVELLRRIRG